MVANILNINHNWAIYEPTWLKFKLYAKNKVPKKIKMADKIYLSIYRN